MPTTDSSIYHYDVAALQHLLQTKLQSILTQDAYQWLMTSAKDEKAFHKTFAQIPRMVGTAAAPLSVEEHQQLQALRPGIDLRTRTADQLARIWLLLQLDTTDKHGYLKKLDDLFLTAAAGEAVALYAALPLLAFPEAWRARCAEGIRSNNGNVLYAIMCGNPYPSEHLNEAGWNQLVLKAIFTDKNLNEIVGLDQRSNPALAQSLLDYARERWAAGRSVNPLLWRVVAPYFNENMLPEMMRLANSGDAKEQQAAALAFFKSPYTAAKDLLKQYPQLQTMADDAALTWESIGDK